MKVLAACEESQAVTKAFRQLGHEAYSCDIVPCSGGHPEWHLQQDVVPLLSEKWDLIIAFPPCTYLSNAGATWLYPKGILNEERYKKGLEGKEFFMKFYNADCDKIAIENPIPSTIYGLPKRSQIIQPYQFGHGFSKKTYLWLKGLPLLKPTEIISNYVQYVSSGSASRKGLTSADGMKTTKADRSKTFPGIAQAMAEQWGLLG